MTKPATSAQRRLAAFLCADVAGYTRLMRADERATLRLLTSHREMTDREIAQHGGRIAKPSSLLWKSTPGAVWQEPSSSDGAGCGAAGDLEAIAEYSIPTGAASSDF